MEIQGGGLDGTRFRLAAVDGRWAEPDGRGPVVEAGPWCVPGMVDAHSHLSADRLSLAPADPSSVAARAFAALEGGVFLCLDKGWSDDVVIQVRDAPPGPLPAIDAAGRMIAPDGGYYPDFARQVEEAELVSAVGLQASRGGGWVKIVGDWPRKGVGPLPNYSEAGLAAAVRAARAAGARVAIHTMAEDVPGMAVRAGVDSIEHGLFLTEVDLEGLAAGGGTWVPTVLRVGEILASLRPGSTGAAVVGAGLERVHSLLPVAGELGLDVRSGTDLAVPSAQVGREAAALVAAGLPVVAALTGLTSRRVGPAEEEASFRIGLPADLVAFGTDPRSDPGTLCSPVLVVHHGRVLVDRR